RTWPRPSTRSPRPPCARWSASTPWTRPWPRPTGSTWPSARSWMGPPRPGARAGQAEDEAQKRAKTIAAEGESLAADQLGAASDVMMAYPLALQLRNLQSLVDIGGDQNHTVVLP